MRRPRNWLITVGKMAMFKKLDAWINRARELCIKFFNFSNRFRPTFYWIKSTWFWVLTWLVVVFLVGGWLAIENWIWLIGEESGGAILRNLALTVLAVIGLPLALWRSRVAERQANTAEHGLLNERYQKGAEMLGSTVLTVRLGGIYALSRLASECPEKYHIQVMQLLCAFVRNPTSKDNEDVHAAMEAIGNRNQMQIAVEQQAKYRADLRNADLKNQTLYGMNLSRVSFAGADLSGAYLGKAVLSDADFFGAKLVKANLSGANLMEATLLGTNLSYVENAHLADFSGAFMMNANLAGANLAGAIFDHKTYFNGANLAGAIFHKDGILAEGLTQRHIAFAIAEPEDNPPTIDGLIDAETGEEIRWSKRPKVV